MKLGPQVTRISFYVVFAGLLAIVQTDLLTTVAGESAGDLVSRNSEAYLMILLVAGYWDLFAWHCEPCGRGSLPACDPKRRWAGQVTFFAALFVGALVTQTGIPGSAGWELAAGIITLGEAFVAGLVISLYVGFTRGFLRGSPRSLGGLPVVSGPIRGWYYLGAVVATVLIYQELARTILGDVVVDWLQVNAEAYAAIVLVPLYFDVVACRGRMAKLAWYGTLVAQPIVLQASDPAGSVLGWLERTTEAFVAALVVSLYFDVVRGWPHRRFTRTDAGTAL